MWGLVAPLGGARHIITRLLAKCVARGTPNVCAMRNDVHQASRGRTARVVTCGGLVAPWEVLGTSSLAY